MGKLMGSGGEVEGEWWRGIEEQVAAKYYLREPLSFAGAIDETWDDIQSLRRVSSIEQLKSALKRFCEFHGVNRSCWQYLQAHDSEPELAKEIIYNGSEATAAYRYEKIFHIDVMNRLTRRSASAIAWGLPHQSGHFDLEEKKLHGFYGEWGCQRGVMFPVRAPGFMLIGGFNFSERAESFLHRIPAFVPQAHIFCASLQEAAVRVLSPRKYAMNVERSPGLTGREKECVKWSSMGKTAWEISCILSISERTVVAHLENAKRKVGARTLPHLVGIVVAGNIVEL